MQGAAPTSRLRRWVETHQLLAFFAVAYLITWAFWAPSVFSDEREGVVSLLFVLGVFGPWVAAALVTHLSGRPVREWMRSIFRFRVAKRWYALALLLPMAIVATSSALIAISGVELDLALLADERLVAFLPTLLFCVLLNGGPEEPGWRGFALPGLQQSMSPVKATAILGPIWAFWHLPLLFISDEGVAHGLEALPFALLILWTIAGIAFGYAFFYTYLWNKTGSVVPSILLHASFNTSNGVLLLIPESRQEGSTYATISLWQTAVVLGCAALLVYLTRGRLGLAPERVQSPLHSAAADSSAG